MATQTNTPQVKTVGTQDNSNKQKQNPFNGVLNKISINVKIVNKK
jgi:hypothetical protein